MGFKTPHRPRISNEEWAVLEEYRRSKTGNAEYKESRFDATAECNSGNHVKSLDQLLDVCAVDLDIWEVASHTVNKWDMTTKKGTRYQNFQVKANLKKKIEILDFYKFKKELIKELQTLVPKYGPSRFAGGKQTGRMAEINIFDLHHGQICYVDETGTHWDTWTSKEEFEQAVQYLVNKAVAGGVDQFLFPVGNDFFNTNSHFPAPQTSRGTPQVDDWQWQKTFKQGRQMIIGAVEYMRQFAPVHIVVIPGNHDTEKSFFLGDVLEVKYEDCPDVVVDNSPQSRKFYKWGNTLIGFTHGTSRNETIPRLHFAIAHHPEWGNTKFREWHLGDKHHGKKVNFIQEEDEQGVNVRWLRSLIATDRYHFDKAYKHQIRGAEAHVWTLDRGLDTVHHYNIVPNHIM